MRICVAILAMGGEGGGVLADWIVDLAEHNGYLAQATSVPGVAQRTGSTIYYLEMFPEAAAAAAGKAPVFALMPVPGEVDIVVASELMEAGRAVQRGLVTAGRTTLIASTNRVYSMIEKSAAGDGRVDSDAIVAACEASAKKFVRSDFAAIAAETGSVISAALFGALASTKTLPFSREQFENAIRRGGVGVESSLQGFAAALDPRRQVDVTVSNDVVLAGRQRLIDYQDERYADEYMRLLQPIKQADSKGTLLTETARQLALWMSYEDAIRVADLKTRHSRFERVRAEAGVRPGQVLKIHDYLYPRIGEIADILPAAIGKWLLTTGWARSVVDRFTQHGKIIETTSIAGYLRLHMLSRLRGWRRRSLRFQKEHRTIREWLALVEELAPENYELALEVAECPSLLKGYGDTHIRGSRNFETVMGALEKVRRRPDAPLVLKKMREAALADETGEQLARYLSLLL